MNVVSPSTPRFKVVEYDNSLEISTKKNFREDKVLPIFLAGAIVTFGLATLVCILTLFIAFDAYSASILSKSSPFLYAPFCSVPMWIISCIGMPLAFVYRLSFQEIISVTKSSIEVHYHSKLSHQSKQYIAKHITDLRVSPNPPTMLWSGRIAFDYGADTFHMGSNLSEAEAKQVIALIVQSDPQYGS